MLFLLPLQHYFKVSSGARVSVAANGALQNSGTRNQDESVLQRRAGPGPEGGPSPEGEGGGWNVAHGKKSEATTSSWHNFYTIMGFL